MSIPKLSGRVPGAGIGVPRWTGRLETTSEHIVRDMREGRFPERSLPQVVHPDFELMRRRYELLCGFAVYVSSLRGRDVQLSDICDAADRALAGDKEEGT